MIQFEVYDEQDKDITTFELDSNPFKVGEEIYLEVQNRDKQVWTNLDELSEDFIITKIRHFNKQDYHKNGAYKVKHTVGLTVKKK